MTRLEISSSVDSTSAWATKGNSSKAIGCSTGVSMNTPSPLRGGEPDLHQLASFQPQSIPTLSRAPG